MTLDFYNALNLYVPSIQFKLASHISSFILPWTLTTATTQGALDIWRPQNFRDFRPPPPPCPHFTQPISIIRPQNWAILEPPSPLRADVICTWSPRPVHTHHHQWCTIFLFFCVVQNSCFGCCTKFLFSVMYNIPVWGLVALFYDVQYSCFPCSTLVCFA